MLRAEFIYAAELAKHPLTKAFAVARAAAAMPPVVAAFAADIGVALAGKVAESVIDAAAAATQPEATTLATTVPLDGFYGRTDVVVDDGCLVLHDSADTAGRAESFVGVFQLSMSPDASAFRFTVRRWEFKRFQGGAGLFQSQGKRDVALRIEWLKPGSETLGARAVFVEHLFPAMTVETMASAFVPGQQLPWFAAPAPPAARAAARNLPLNIRVTLVETTKPNQFGVWVRALAQERKADILTAVKKATQRAVDPAFDAGEAARLADAGGVAFAAYKAAWEDLAAHQTTKPSLPLTGPTPAEQAKLADWTARFTIKSQVMRSKLSVARTAFAAAGLPWPGDLPAID